MKNREEWIDAVKGLTICLVVMYHLFGGVNNHVGFSEQTLSLYELATTIRMPLFFLVAGFFAYKAIHASWNEFVDKKIFHFLYFYLLWNSLTIIGAFLLTDFSRAQQLAMFAWVPFRNFWFLYALMLCFLFARYSRNLPFSVQLSSALMASCLLYFLPKIPIPEVFSGTIKYYPCFLTGIYLSGNIRRFVVEANWRQLAGCALVFSLLSVIALEILPVSNPFLYYPMAAAVSLLIMGLIQKIRGTGLFNVLVYLGERGLYIFVLYTVPVMLIQQYGLKYGLGAYPGALVIFGSIAAVAICIGLYSVLSKIPALSFLFHRPDFAHYRVNSHRQEATARPRQATDIR